MVRSTVFTTPIQRFVTYAKLFPADRFDPNLLILTDEIGIVKAVGPLGLVYLSCLGTFEIKKRDLKNSESTPSRFRGKTLYRNNEWGYQAIALYWGVPSAKIVECLLHPDYYDNMTIKKIIDRCEKMMYTFLHRSRGNRHANFFKWFDKAFGHVPPRPHRDLCPIEHTIISSHPKEFGFFPYAFRAVQDIKLEDYYERKNRSAGRRALLKTSNSTDRNRGADGRFLADPDNLPSDRMPGSSNEDRI